MKHLSNSPTRPNDIRRKSSKSLRARTAQHSEMTPSTGKHNTNASVPVRLENKLDALASQLESKHAGITPPFSDTMRSRHSSGMGGGSTAGGRKNAFSHHGKDMALSTLNESEDGRRKVRSAKRPSLQSITSVSFCSPSSPNRGPANKQPFGLSTNTYNKLTNAEARKEAYKRAFPRAELWDFSTLTSKGSHQPFVYYDTSRQASQGQLNTRIARARKMNTHMAKAGMRWRTDNPEMHDALEAYQAAVKKYHENRAKIFGRNGPSTQVHDNQLDEDQQPGLEEDQESQHSSRPTTGMSAMTDKNNWIQMYSSDKSPEAWDYDKFAANAIQSRGKSNGRPKEEGGPDQKDSTARPPIDNSNSNFTPHRATSVRKDVSSQLTGGRSAMKRQMQHGAILTDDQDLWTSELKEVPPPSPFGLDGAQNGNLGSSSFGGAFGPMTSLDLDMHTLSQTLPTLDGKISSDFEDFAESEVRPRTDSQINNVAHERSRKSSQTVSRGVTPASVNSLDEGYYESDHMYKIFGKMGHERAKMGSRRPSARTLYVQVCEDQQIAPLPILDNLEHTQNGEMNLEIPNYGIGDKACLALANFFKMCTIPLMRLDLSANCLTGPAIATLLSGLVDSQQSRISSLKLAHNRMDVDAAKALARFFKSHATFPELKEVDVSHCRLSDLGIIEIAKSIATSLTVEKLSFKGNEISSQGKDSKAGPTVAKMVQESYSISYLDLSWNNIRGDHAKSIAEALSLNNNLIHLNLSFNHFGTVEICALLAQAVEASGVNSFTTLDVSFNHVCGQAAAILIDVLTKENVRFDTLIMDGNPVKEIGLAALVKALTAEKKISMSVKQCDFLEARSTIKPNPTHDRLPLWPSRAAGKYNLDLKNAYHRLLAGYVIELATKHGGGETIQNMIYQPDLTSRLEGSAEAEIFELPDLEAENAHESFQAPSQGRLEFTFVWRPAAIFKKPELPERKFRPFITRLKRLGEADERLVLKLLDLVICAFALYPSQIQEVMECVNSSSSKVLLTMMVFPQTLEEGDVSQLLGSLKPHEMEQVEQRLGRNLFWFNPANPTGHYRLNLALPTDRLVAQRLFELNAMEKALRINQNKPDVSQYGTFDLVRNTTLDHKHFKYTEEFLLPTKGWLSFDFVSQLRAENPQAVSKSELDGIIEKCLSISEAEEQVDMKKIRTAFESTKPDDEGKININQMQQLMKKLGHHLTAAAMMSLYEQVHLNANETVGLNEVVQLKQQIQKNAKIEARIGQLRRISTDICLTVAQLGNILEYLENSEDRIDAVCLFSPRLVDEENLYRVLAGMIEAESKAVLSRLGHLNVFNPFQPYGLYHLNLAFEDDRKLAVIVANMGIPGETLVEETLDGNPAKFEPKTRKELFPQGIYSVKLLPRPVHQDARPASRKSAKSGTSAKDTGFNSVGDRVGENHSQHALNLDETMQTASVVLGWNLPISTTDTLEQQIHIGIKSIRTNEIVF